MTAENRSRVRSPSGVRVTRRVRRSASRDLGEVAAADEGGDELSAALLGHPHPCRELGDGDAAVRNRRQHPDVRRAQAVPLVHEVLGADGVEQAPDELGHVARRGRWVDRDHKATLPFSRYQRNGDDMANRSILGPADVDEMTFTGIVARALGEPPDRVTVLDSTASVVPYPLDAITTAGRYWVTARASTPGGERTARLFVKHVQSWSRSPFFRYVPEELRAMAEASVPWRTEALVYRSDLHRRLPPGMTMPVALHVAFLDEASTAVWLPALDVVEKQWHTTDFARAAFLLGRLAASADVAELAALGDSGGGPRTVRTYAEGRLAVQVAPALRSDELWQAPAVAEAFDDELRARLLATLDEVPSFVDELRGGARRDGPR